ncbi:(deoxy)nucleoside triphosphate pyrophosphohydrolase [Oleidesulfovibrio sp.]|uniref:(deoxy)nucleoside triphosphate pyrophosphohydrolase n=1 Tax=Oleidesulfovibrio sp. TaxID=2909707 RepID=UPI003A83EAEE
MPVVEVVAGILWRDGRFLAVERPEGKPRAGFWEFPGGKLESGESAEEALVRELKEELGIGVQEYRFWRHVVHAYDDFTVRLHFYHVTGFSGEPQGLEGHALAWLDAQAAAALSFLEADRPLVADLAHVTFD